ncbi:unnamed protein product [Closterium sp. NIES-64]|nr:unnamed protein product [Closterium sp. NIES-64]
MLVLRQAYEWGEQNFLKPHFHFDSILDAGANIGLTSVLFATMYPKATIISVEASSCNFRSLKLNTQPFPNVIAVNAALYPKAMIISVEASSRNFRSLKLNTQPFPNIIAVNAALWPRVASLSLTLVQRNPKLPPEWAFMVKETRDRNPELSPEWAFMVKETPDPISPLPLCLLHPMAVDKWARHMLLVHAAAIPSSTRGQTGDVSFLFLVLYLFPLQLEPGQVVEDSPLGVTVPFLLKVFGLPGFDFLKIDIEGSEGKIFREDREMNPGWVNESKLAALELHGDMVPGSNVTVLNFFNRRSNFHHKKDWSGEYDVFMRNDANLS